MLRREFLLVVPLLLAAMPVPAADNMKAFPPPGPGMERKVIELPPLPDENAVKVELLVGRTMTLDARNRYFFGGALKAETIDGWGFTRYVLPRLGPMGGTLIAVDPAEPKVERFVSLRGDPQLVRYNSRLPIVVYVPKDVEVRYRLWRADPAFRTAAPG